MIMDKKNSMIFIRCIALISIPIFCKASDSSYRDSYDDVVSVDSEYLSAQRSGSTVSICQSVRSGSSHSVGTSSKNSRSSLSSMGDFQQQDCNNNSRKLGAALFFGDFHVSIMDEPEKAQEIIKWIMKVEHSNIQEKYENEEEAIRKELELVACSQTENIMAAFFALKTEIARKSLESASLISHTSTPSVASAMHDQSPGSSPVHLQSSCASIPGVLSNPDLYDRSLVDQTPLSFLEKRT